MYDHSSESLESAHAQLLDRRARLAMLIGVPLFALNSLEPWFDFRDPATFKIQLGADFLMLCLACFSCTPWGSRHKLAIFTTGYLIAVAGYEFVVCHERAFNTAYSDGFPTVFAYYSILIPATVYRVGAVGLATILVTSIPEALITHDFVRVANAFVADSTPLVILLCGRHVANTLWAREFVASRRHSEFVSAVSHEFRNLAASICVLADELKSGTVSSEEDKSECYRILASDGQRLRRRVEELLDFGRMLAGTIEYKLEYIEPAQFLREVAAEFQSDVAPRGYSVEVKVADGLPLVLGSRPALASAIWNLLDNAVKYSPDCFSVWVEAALVNERVQISVRDRGPGIPQNEQPNIFQKFIRGDAARAGGIQGLGLGLYIVTRIVEAHRGEITLKSESGEGSTFTVQLPVRGQK